MQEPFPHTHHTGKITFPQLPNGRDKLLTWASTLLPRKRFPDAELKGREGRLPVVMGPTLHPRSPDPHLTLVNLLRGTFALLSLLHKTHILRLLFLPS